MIFKWEKEKNMRILKTNPVLTILNSYLVDSPQPSTLSYLWNFGSLLGLCLVAQIVTGVLVSMHYQGSASDGFTSVEHVMRDVNDGWLLRMCHANMASFFFIAVYLHIARGLYFGSYRTPRVGVWVIGTIIFFLMMAIRKMWPKRLWLQRIRYMSLFCTYNFYFSKPRIKALYRIGPHNIDVLSVIVCGMLGDWWGDKLVYSSGYSIRFHIEQGIVNSAYIHHLSSLFIHWGYCSKSMPKLVTKKENKTNKLLDSKFNRSNYRLTLYTFTSLSWIYDSFYKKTDKGIIKVVPYWIEDFITPIGLAHWIMQDGSRQKGQGVYIATHSFTYLECRFLSQILYKKYKLKSTVIKTGCLNQWRISIWKRSMNDLVAIIKPYIIDEMKYKLKDYI
jgi:ubiquinol-cytochrome c reductase cytochrome b subunit